MKVEMGAGFKKYVTYTGSIVSKYLHQCWKFDNNNEHEYQIKKYLFNNHQI